MPVKDVRDAVGQDGPRSCRREVLGDGVDVAHENIGVVSSHDAGIERSVGALEALHGYSGVLEGLIDRLKEKSLEGID